MNHVKKLRFATLLALASALTLPACVLINKFDKLEVVVSGRDVAFTLPDKDLADKNKRFMLYGIDVGLDNCERNCEGGWEMVRKIDSTVDLVEENFVKFPIRYGVTLPNMQTRELHKLKQGRYVVTASFTVIKRGQVVGSKKAIGGFTIE